MANIAYNLDLNHEELILNALAFKDEGKRYSYVCNDEQCTAVMHVRGGKKPSFFSNTKIKHRVGCQFEHSSSSEEQPPGDINDWYNTLLEKPDLSTKVNVGGGLIAVKKRNSKLSFTTCSLYKLQCGLEVEDYIDERQTISVSDFIVSSRTIHDHTEKSICGVHLYVGVIERLDYKAAKPYILWHLTTKGTKQKPLRIKFDFFSKELCYQTYKTIVDKYQTINPKGKGVCFLTNIVASDGIIPIPDSTNCYKFEYQGTISSNRQFYVL